MGTTSTEGELGKLRWRCRRGMKELDLLLTRYVEEDYLAATPEQQAAFRALLDSQDPVLNDYFLGREHPSDPVLRSLIERITVKVPNAR
jgi:antitoxin CptB